MHALVCFPTLSRLGVRKVSALYEQYETASIAPHFTLVFPTMLSLAALQAHCDPIISASGNITFTFRCAQVIRNSFNELWQVFLVPDTGYSQILKLHDKLYTGVLSADLRLDIPYIPHITIGSFTTGDQAKAVADQLNAQHLMLSGTLNEVSYIKIEKENPIVATTPFIIPKS